jgi:hypothetical protein
LQYVLNASQLGLSFLAYSTGNNNVAFLLAQNDGVTRVLLSHLNSSAVI